MSIPWEVVTAFAVGLCLLALFGRVLLVPMRFVWRMAAGVVLGALVIVIINFLGLSFGFKVALNPFTAFIVGILGLPGALLICVLSYYVL